MKTLEQIISELQSNQKELRELGYFEDHDGKVAARQLNDFIWYLLNQ